MPTKLAALLLPLITLALGTPAAVEGGFVNGGFEQWTGGFNGAASQLGTSGTGGYTALTGWTLGGGTYGFLMAPGLADKTGSYSPQYGNSLSLWGSNNGGVNTLPASSPNGGDYVVLDGGSSYRGGGISQVITGLTFGQQYAVTFDWASGQQHGYDGATTESFQVSFGNQVQNTATVNNVSHGFTPWQQQTFVFTADGTSDALNFLAIGTPGGLPPMVLLDGVSFAAVPEPGSLALVGVGLVVTAAVRRVRRRAAASA